MGGDSWLRGLEVESNVTSKKSPNVYKSYKNDFTKKIKVFEAFTIIV